ncbi:MAG: hypothetical protein OXI87_08950 [Albidovulum sp.]|nr:hypothetical protein [Albidovulum sp.]MDE0530070.1 hypothetical protein [Albidovulum sp.]
MVVDLPAPFGEKPEHRAFARDKADSVHRGQVLVALSDFFNLYHV